jgi:Tfp pilus assembly protein PilN
MLGRLRITQRLSLLLLLPLGSVVLLSVPFTVDRVDDARAAATIVESANNARAVDAVIQELQQERLLALAYLGSTRLSRSALVAQIQSTIDNSARARDALSGPASARLREALTKLDRLTVVRQSVVDHRARMADVYRAYHGAAIDLIDALRLRDLLSTDAPGLHQMGSLDTLFRSNEEGNQVGAALIIAATDPATAAAFASSARVLELVQLKSFRQQGDPLHVALLDQAGDRFTSARGEAIVDALTRPNPFPRSITIDESLSLAQSGVAIRRVAQVVGRTRPPQPRSRSRRLRPAYSCSWPGWVSW